VRNLHTAAGGELPTATTREKPAQQQRPSTTKNKYNYENLKKKLNKASLVVQCYESASQCRGH